MVAFVGGWAGSRMLRQRSHLAVGKRSAGLNGQCRSKGVRGLRMTAAAAPGGDDAATAGKMDETGSLSDLTKVQGSDEKLDRKYKGWRYRIFYSIFIGYATFYFTRNSFTYAAPGMRAALGLSLEQLGLITSIFPLCYGFSKLFAGILSDRFSTRQFLALGLAMTGVINILFGFQTSLYVMIPLWALNGVFQGFGAPPCAKLLTTWYAKSERGTWWGFWNTSHNTGGFLIPLVAGYCVRAFGWQYGLIVPGIIAILISFFLYDRVRDNPGEVGLPPVDVFKEEETAEASKSAAKAKEKGDAWETLKKHVLSNPAVWLLAVSYFFVYFVRQGVSSWAHIFLLDYKMVGNAQEAAFRVSGMEIGGLLGSLTSGWASDRMMRGRRIPIIILWMLGVMASLVGFYFVPGSWRYVSWLSVFCIGFFIYGPQMLVGLAGAEIVDKSAVSSAIGLLGWIAYLGASIAGFPLTKIVTNYGWGAYVASLLTFSGIAVLLLLPMWRLGMPSPAVLPPKTEDKVPCDKCAATGFVIKLECGPATPNQAMSCKFSEVTCVNCNGTGFVSSGRQLEPSAAKA